MRVIAGSYKGRTLKAPDWEGLRPTSDKLRETLFNILGPSIRGARVLDGYAGTGAVGIEALSRGAEHVTFVERDIRAARLITTNLERCGVTFTDRCGSTDASNPCAIIREGFTGAAKRLVGAAFDVIFLDPPYGAGALAEALTAAGPLVGEDTLLVIEHAKRDAAPSQVGPLRCARSVTSGDSALAFYRRSE